MLAERTPTVRWSLARRFVVAAAASLAATVWIHGFAAILRHAGAEEMPVAALAFTLAGIATALAGCVALPRRFAEVAAMLAGAWASHALEAHAPGTSRMWLALVPLGALVTYGARLLGERLPEGVDRVLETRRVLAIAWALLALVSVVQTARLATHMSDREVPFVLTTDHPFWYGHECLGAYLYGAELSARGEPNLYHHSHYPALDRNAEPDSALEGVALEDPYQYPPQFLLLPRLVLELTHDVPLIRVLWFCLQTSLFAAVAAALALWVGGPAGRVALWTLPFVMTSFPALHNFQFGQFHLAALALSVAAMLAFSRRRRVLGGTLLACAISAKLFPAVLLAYLAARLRWKDVAWTLAAGAALFAIALAVLGPAPFVAFAQYQLPRLGDGSAFAFDEAWPELGDLVLADNQGVYGLARKLGADKPLAGWVSRIFGVAVFGIAAICGIRRPRGSRLARAATWIALLGLATLASPGAWGDYVPVAAVWLLSLAAYPMTRTTYGLAAFAVVLPMQYLLLGTMPIGDFAPHAAMVGVSAFGVVSMLGLFAAGLFLRTRDEDEPLPARPDRRPEIEATAPLRTLV